MRRGARGLRSVRGGGQTLAPTAPHAPGASSLRSGGAPIWTLSLDSYLDVPLCVCHPVTLDCRAMTATFSAARAR